MMAARQLGRAALLARASLLCLPQQAARGAPVATLLSLGSLGSGCSSALAAPGVWQGTGGTALADRPRSFASNAAPTSFSATGGSTCSGRDRGSSSAGRAGGSALFAGGSSAAACSPSHPQQQQQRNLHAGPLLQQEQQPAEQPQLRPERVSFKVEASYVGSRINIYDLMHRAEFVGHYKKLHKGTVVLGLTHRPVDPACELTGMPLDPYMVAFSYGSVVFFNADREMKDAYLQVCREEAADVVPADKPYAEEFGVSVNPAEDKWSRTEADCIHLKVLDLKNIQVISQVLAQSVAMDFYSSHVERTLETFCNMNLEMQESKNITKINKQVLLQMVAENNIVMTDIINKLRVHERYDIAWKQVEYGVIWDFLRSELEMDGRFKTMEMKLNLIQDNLKYFLEILQNRKSDSLEWIIIILIGAEICLSVYDLVSKAVS